MLLRRLAPLARPLWAPLACLIAVFAALLADHRPGLRLSEPDATVERSDVQPSAALDPTRICYARQEYRYLRQMEAHCASARSVADYRRWQPWAAAARADYRRCYRTVTPAGRLRAHLPPPEGERPA